MPTTMQIDDGDQRHDGAVDDQRREVRPRPDRDVVLEGDARRDVGAASRVTMSSSGFSEIRNVQTIGNDRERRRSAERERR